MVIHEIKVRELPGFVESGFFKSIHPKPITRLRAISQFNNPRARPDDTALIIACEGNTLLAMAGLLPDYIAGNPGLSASSNSGWWAHPEKGRHLALPVFAKALKYCKYRMFLTDCTSFSREILEKTGWFEFPDPVNGVKTIFRSYFYQMAEHRFGTGFILKMAGVADKLINSMALPVLNQGKYKNIENAVTVTRVSVIDDHLSRFITEHSSDEFTRRSASDIEWALQWKWLQTAGKDESVNYPFSFFTTSFWQMILVFTRNDNISGLAVVNIRNNHATAPCFYCDSGEEESIWDALIRYLFQLKVNTFTSFRKGYIRCLKEHKVHGLFSKQVYRHIAFSKELINLFHGHPLLQDGDGDCIFT